MPDNNNLRGKKDADLVAFEQQHEREWFCHRLRCSETEMLLAMWAAGSWSRRAVTQMLNDARAVLRETRAKEEKDKLPRVRKRKAKPNPLRRVGRAYLSAEKRARRAAGRYPQ